MSVASLASYLAAEPLTPLGLFRSSIFSISAAQFLMATMVLFVAMLYVIPLLVGLVAATAIAGPFVTRTGRYKIYPVIGAVLADAGSTCSSRSRCWPGRTRSTTATWAPPSAPSTSSSPFGGAYGAALFGAILVHGLTAGRTADAHQAVFAWTVPLTAWPSSSP